MTAPRLGRLPPAADCCPAEANTPQEPVGRDSDWHRAVGQARLLSWLSLGYMAAEGRVAITAAILAGSVALLGLGLDSVIESPPASS